MSDLFNSVENWFNSTTNSIEQWRDDHGEEILVADGLGAAYGAGKAFVTAEQNLLFLGQVD